MGFVRMREWVAMALVGLVGCTMAAGTSTAGGPHPEPLAAKADGHAGDCATAVLQALEDHVWATHPLHRELAELGGPGRYQPELYQYEERADGGSTFRLWAPDGRCFANYELDADGWVQDAEWLGVRERTAGQPIACGDAIRPAWLDAAEREIHTYVALWHEAGIVPAADLTSALREAGLSRLEHGPGVYEWDDETLTLDIGLGGGLGAEDPARLEARFEAGAQVADIHLVAARLVDEGASHTCELP